MKKSLLFIFYVLSSVYVMAQMPTNGDYSKWNWENQTQSNWKMKNGNRWVDIQPPFLWNTDKSPHLDDIFHTQDYTHEKGWRLVHANFDGVYPYFVLYNQYNSILRTYIHTGSTVNYKGIMTVLTPSEKLKELKILNSALEYQFAMDDDRKLDITNLSVLDINVGLGSWSVADFLISFDYKVTMSDFKNQKWNIAFFTVNTMDLELKITGTSTPVPVSELGNVSFSGSDKALSSNGFDASYAKANKAIQSSADFFEKMQKSAGKIKDDAWKPLLKYKNTMDKVSKVGNFLSAAASFSSGIGVATSMLGMFSGGMGSQSVPMGYVHNFDAKGTITFQQKVRETQFQVPGIEYTNEARPNWAFKCPMGIINVKEAPVIYKTTPYLRVKNRNYSIKKKNLFGTYYTISGNGVIFQKEIEASLATFHNNVKKNYSFIGYSFVNGINLQTNEISGLRVENIQAAIVCKSNNKRGDNKNYMISSNEYGEAPLKYRNSSSLNGFSFHMENPIYYDLQSERFVVHKYEDNDEDVYFGTPYMDINSLKSVIFEVPENTDVLLGLLVTYYAPNSTEPQLYKALYRFNEVERSIDKDILFFDEELPTWGFTEGKLLTSTVSKINYNCTSNNPGTKSLAAATNILEEKQDTDVKIHLTSDNILHIDYADLNEKYDIAIYNMQQGRIVLSKKGMHSYESIYMDNYPKGIYIVSIKIGDEIYQEKVLLK